jgi:purine-binding chemotaxis protein CheW
MSKISQFLTFGIESECFALPVERVREVLDLRPISRLPNAPDYVLGLIDVRGASLLVVDLRLKFGFPALPPTNRTRIVVVEAIVEGAALGLGLMADCVFAVSDLDGGALEPPPSIGERWRADYVVGVGREGGRFVVALDLDRLISGETQSGHGLAA